MAYMDVNSLETPDMSSVHPLSGIATRSVGIELVEIVVACIAMWCRGSGNGIGKRGAVDMLDGLTTGFGT